MVNLKKGGKQRNTEQKSAAENSEGIVNQETIKQPSAKQDTRKKAAVKTTENKAGGGETESKMEEEIEEPVEEMSDKKMNGRKRKADQKEKDDVQEKQSKSKKSKQAQGSAANSEDESSENGVQEKQPEKEAAATKTQRGRKTTEKKNVEEMDVDSEMSSEKASSSGDGVVKEVKTTKRGRAAQKGKTEKDTENSEDAEGEDGAEGTAVNKQQSKAKGARRGTEKAKTAKELNSMDVESETELAKADKNSEETASKAPAKGAKKGAENTKAVNEQKKKAAPEKMDGVEEGTSKNTKTKSDATVDKKDSKVKPSTKGAKNTQDAHSTVDENSTENEPPKKKARVVVSVVSHSSHRTASGVVLTVGEGDTGQLGLGPDVQERGKPGLVEMDKDTVQICAGGMHSVCLTVNGEVYTFGCNDEGSLGRPTKEEEDCMEPGKVDLPEKIVLVSAGDSHTAALSEFGQVYIWGTFRDANGSIGIFPGQGKLEKPEKILPNVTVVKIGSGCDHLVCLTTDGDIYTMGAAEQGQLGRVAECFSVRGGRKGLDLLLVPSMVKCNKRNQKFVDIWTGQYVTFAKAKDSGEIYAWGLNNYYQLGFADMRNKFVPEKSTTFEKSKDWKEFSSGQHHTVALDKDGLVYSLGRKEYGRLGLGSEGLTEKTAPTLVTSLQDKKCVNVNCGSAVSFAVDDEGKIYGWGIGSNKQLGQGNDEEDAYEPKHITGKQLDDKFGLMVSAGGQHTMFLAQNRS